MGSAEFVLGRKLVVVALLTSAFGAEVGAALGAQLTGPVGEDEAPGELTCGPGVCGPDQARSYRRQGRARDAVLHASPARYEVTW